jgi:hypothetical protein
MCRPDEALLSVSQRFVADQELGSPAVTDAVARMCLTIHRDVEAASSRFFSELRRRFYTTPKSYLDLIALYLQLLSERRWVGAGGRALGRSASTMPASRLRDEHHFAQQTHTHTHAQVAAGCVA